VVSDSTLKRKLLQNKKTSLGWFFILRL